MTDATETGQVVDSAAAFYQDFFVPALFGQFAAPLCDAAGVVAGQKVLDVACGTGALTRAVATRVGNTGAAHGVDRNPGMLSAARNASADAIYHEGMAEALPFADNTFYAVLSQFGLMFFEDRVKGLSEMGRVARPGGAIAVAVWAGLASAPGYRALAAIFDEVLGNNAGDSLRVPFSMGDAAALVGLATAAGLAGPSTQRLSGTARFASVADCVTTEVRGWTLSDSVSDEALADLITVCEQHFSGYTTADGRFTFPCQALVLTASAP